LVVGGCGAVCESVGEIWEERRVRLGVDAGGMVLVEGSVLDVNHWFGGCVSLALGVPLEVGAAWLGAYQRSPQHAA
jgi:hypothetical protein